MTRVNKSSLLYSVLVSARVVLAFSPGYIHPDEWFQYGEVLAGIKFDIDVLKTWEFDPTFPCRSMASLKLFGLLFSLLGPAPSSFALFAASRLTFLFYSFAIDWSAWHLLPPQDRWKGMISWAGSGAALAFSVRSFSNNVEASLLALCFVALQKLAVGSFATSENSCSKDSHWLKWSCLLGVFVSVGVFSRFTFAIFALPIGLTFLGLAWRRSILSNSRWRNTSTLLLGAVLTALAVACLHVLYDTWYFAVQSSRSFWPPVITPLNAALYNSRADNLASHGLHPRWLHAVVNAPMILGIGPWLDFVLRLGSIVDSAEDISSLMRKVMASTVFSSLAILSIQPHQEPRFLLPLVLPACILFARSKSSRYNILSYMTVAQAIAVTVFFGLLHQGGTIPAMLDLSGRLEKMTATSRGQHISLLFWRSFMPPRHLLMPGNNRQDKSMTIQDLQSMPAEQLIDLLSTIDKDAQLLLFAPAWAFNSAAKALLRHRGIDSAPLTRAYLHLDTDHLGESFEVDQTGQSIFRSFSYRAWHLSHVPQ